MDKFLTMADVQKRFRLSLSTVQRLIKSGDLPAYRIGGSVRIKEADVEKALKPIPVGDPS
jgi:excisionase family DNA binding protein